MDEATWKLTFFGRVQGVGFRYFVSTLAADFPVSGYVRNLSNGAVEVVVVGHFAALESFLKEIKSSSPGQIDQVDVDRESPQIKPLDSFMIVGSAG